MISDNAKKAVFSQETAEIFTALITISHQSMADDIRIATDNKDFLPTAGARGIISRGDEYIYMPVSIELPSQDDTGVSRARISIDNVGRDAIAAIRNSASGGKVTFKIEIILSSDPDNIEMSIPNLRLDRVTYDAFTIQGDISAEYYDLEPFPKGRFVPSEWPGIF